MEELGDAAARSGELVRGIMATVLIVAAIAALALTGLIRSHGNAVAQLLLHEQSSGPTALAVPSHIPTDSGEVAPFAFGHVEFDWNPRAPGGVPGFNSWPPAAQP